MRVKKVFLLILVSLFLAFSNVCAIDDVDYGKDVINVNSIEDVDDDSDDLPPYDPVQVEFSKEEEEIYQKMYDKGGIEPWYIRYRFNMIIGGVILFVLAIGAIVFVRVKKNKNQENNIYDE